MNCLNCKKKKKIKLTVLVGNQTEKLSDIKSLLPQSFLRFILLLTLDFVGDYCVGIAHMMIAFTVREKLLWLYTFFWDNFSIFLKLNFIEVLLVEMQKVSQIHKEFCLANGLKIVHPTAFTVTEKSFTSMEIIHWKNFHLTLWCFNQRWHWKKFNSLNEPFAFNNQQKSTIQR